jgi:dihydroorotase
VKALQDAVMNGHVDCIATHHFPQHWDNKVCEFEYAKDGMTGLETSFGLVAKVLPKLSDERLVELFQTNAAKLLNLSTHPVQKDVAAELTLFTRKGDHAYNAAHSRSKSRNTPLDGVMLGGKVIGIINKGQVFLN